MTSDQERAREELSLARTALDEGFTDGVNEPLLSPEKAREYAIDRIDTAMRLLSPEKEEQKFALLVAQDGTFVSRHFDAEEETIDAVGYAINMKENNPDSVVTLIVGRVEP